MVWGFGTTRVSCFAFRVSGLRALMAEACIEGEVFGIVRIAGFDFSGL